MKGMVHKTNDARVTGYLAGQLAFLVGNSIVYIPLRLHKRYYSCCHAFWKESCVYTYVSDITYVPNVYITTNNYCLVCTLMLTRTQDGDAV